MFPRRESPPAPTVKVERLVAQLERFRVLTEAAMDVTSIVDEDGTIRYESPAVRRVVGWTPAELVGRNAFEFVHPDDRATVREALDNLSLRGASGRAVEYRWATRNGGYRWLESIAVDCRHVRSVRGIVIHSRDVTERYETRTQLDRLARYDELTGLLNRASLRLDLPAALERTAASGRTGAVLFVDLDRFKLVNDTLGHGVGDRVLHEVARRLAETLRASDGIYRVGGDEFVVVLDDAHTRDDVTVVARSLCDALGRPIVVDEQELPVGCSVGIALFESGVAVDELLRRADTAMYRVKEDRRGGFRFYAPAMEATLRRRLDLERELRRALREDGFSLVYQPIVALASGDVGWVEALVRWPGGDGAERGPASFLAIAEETKLIVPLGTWVLRRACATAKRWRAAGVTAKLVVNVSAGQLNDEAFPEVVAGVLAAEGLCGDELAFDLQETALAAATPETISSLERMRAMGIAVALDDFGSGSSSLGALRRFAVDALKVDGAFVAGIGRDGRDEALVRAIVAMGRGTSMAVVAEGVETVEQLAFLRDLGCSAAQGRHIAPLLDDDAIVPWLVERAARPPLLL